MSYPISGGRIETAKKVIVYGPEGIGKTTFAARFPDPVFIDTEHSTDAYEVKRFPYPTSWAMLTGEVQQVRDDPSCCRTLVIDTADWAEKLCTAALLARCKKSGIEEFGYGKGYVYLGEDFGKLLNLLEEVKARGVNVVLTAHAKLSKFEQPDELGSYDRWELKLSKYILPMVKEWADLILFANYKTFAVASDDSGKKFKAQGGKRVMYTTHHPCWDAKNRYGLTEELPFEFEAIAALFGGSAPAAAQALHVSAPVPKEMPQESPILSAATADPLPALAEKPQPAPAAAQAALPGTPQYQEESCIQQQKLMANGVPEQLAQLMAANHITEQQVQNVVGNVRGYFPADMPIKDYPADFLQGVLIGAWPQVLDMITQCDDVPF